jgi:hypothetical protein
VASSEPAALARKLGVRAGQRVALLGAPAGWDIGGLPHDVVLVGRRSVRRADVVVAFIRRLTELERQVDTLGRTIVPDGVLWLAWPRRAGGHESDITDTVLRTVLLPTGLVDVKVAALDEDWSGLKFVWRLEHRPALR